MKNILNIILLYFFNKYSHHILITLHHENVEHPHELSNEFTNLNYAWHLTKLVRLIHQKNLLQNFGEFIQFTILL